MKKGKLPHLHLRYSSQIQDDEIELDSNLFRDEKITVQVEKSDENIFMATEWAIPTIIVAYILQPYFAAFFSELGKDHYNKLKSGLKKLTHKIKVKNAFFIAAKESPEKLSLSYGQSALFSIVFQTINSRQVKLLFNSNLEIIDWESSIDRVLSLLIENYVMYPNDVITGEFNKRKIKDWDVLYILMDKDLKEIKFFSNEELMKKYKYER